MIHKISWEIITSLKSYTVWFLLYANLKAIEIYLSEAAAHLLLPHIKLFKKTGTSLPALFSAWFLEKNFSLVVIY